MANYSLVINSKFRPFSYSELMAPVQQSTEAHQQVEAAYGALDTQASKWENLANQQTDERAYAMYKTYADDLRAQADNLARNGLTTMSRKDLLNMHSRYSKEIVPIETAYNRRQTLADEQRKIMLTDPTRRFERDANTISLDTLIDNPAYDYGRNYSGSMLTQQVSNAVAGLARELRDYGRGKRLDAYTNTFLKKRGMTSEEVTQFIKDLHNPDSEAYNSALGKVVNSVIASSGVGSWGNKQALDEAYDFAGLGTWNAIGQSDVTPFTDQGALLAAKERLMNKTDKPSDKPSDNNIRTRSIFTKREKDELDKQQKNAARLKEYFKSVKDNKGNIKYVLTPEGRKRFQEDFDFSETRDPISGSRHTRSTTRNLNSMGITKEQFNSMSNEEIGEFWQARYESKLSRPDGKKYTEYYYPIDQTVQKDARDLIFNAASGANAGNLWETDFDKELLKYVQTKDKHTIDELKDKDYYPVSTSYGPYGFNVLFRSTKEGNKDIEVQMPLVDERRYEEMLDLINNADIIQQKLNSHAYTNSLEKGMAEDALEALQLQMYDDMAGMFRTNTQESFKTK